MWQLCSNSSYRQSLIVFFFIVLELLSLCQRLFLASRRKREKRVAWAPYLLFRLQIWQCHKRAALQNLSPHLQKKKKSMLASCFMSWARNGCIYERIWTDWNTWSIHTPIFAQHNSHSHTHTQILSFFLSLILSHTPFQRGRTWWPWSHQLPEDHRPRSRCAQP